MLVKQQFPEANCIAGVATAGIPMGALIADELNLPFIYVRAKPKEHGLKNTIEGELIQNDKTVVVEDTVSTGKSSLQAVTDLRNAGANVLGMVAIYSYVFPETASKFKNSSVPLYTLTDYNALIQAALFLGAVPTTAESTLSDWRQDPANWKMEVL